MNSDDLTSTVTTALLDQLNQQQTRDGAADPGRSWVSNGGTSLEAYAAVMRLEQDLGVVVTVSRLLGPQALDVVAASALTAPAPSGPRVLFAPDGNPVPATASQRRHWRHAQGEGSAAFLNIGHALHCARDFDSSQAESAFRALVARHESLRHIYLVDDEARLILREIPDWSAKVAFEVHGLVDSPGEATTLIDAAIGRPFALDQAPPVRGGCVPLQGGGGVVYFAVHHIAADGWSVDLLASDLLELYTAPEVALRDTTPFSEYALLMDSRAREGRYVDDIAFWRKKFEGVSPDFTVARGAAQAAGQRADSLSIAWDGPGEAETVRATARALGVTTYSLMLSALLTATHVLSGEDDVVVMSGVANRASARVRDTVGLFTNQIFFRGDFRQIDTSTAAFVRAVHADVVESLGRSELPVEVVLDELDAYEKARTLAPYANILFQAADAPLAPAAIRDGTWAVHPLGAGSIKRHCNIHLVDTPGHLALDLAYSLALVGKADAQRLLAAVRAGVELLVDTAGSSPTVSDLVARVRKAAGAPEPTVTVLTVDYPGARSEPALVDFVRERFPEVDVVELPVPQSLDTDEVRSALEAGREALLRVQGEHVVVSYCSASAWAGHLIAQVGTEAGQWPRLVAINPNSLGWAGWADEATVLVSRLDTAAGNALMLQAPAAGSSANELWHAASSALAVIEEALESAYLARFGSSLSRVATDMMQVQLRWLAYLGSCVVLSTLHKDAASSRLTVLGDMQAGDKLVHLLRPELASSLTATESRPG